MSVVAAGTSWQFYPSAPPVLILLGGAMLAGLAVYAYRRTVINRWASAGALLVMRLALIAMLTWMLLGASRSDEPLREAVRPKLTVLVDTSQSMLTEDCQGTSRIAFAAEQWLNEARLWTLGKQFDVTVRGFDDRPGAIDLAGLAEAPGDAAIGQVTHLIASVAAAVGELSGQDGAGLLLLSDGRDTEGRALLDATALARLRRMPIHTVCLGGPAVQNDLAAVVRSAPAYQFVDEPGQISVEVRHTGFTGRQSTLHLRSGDWHVERAVRFGPEPTVTIELPVTADTPGLHEYAIAVEPMGGEVETNNNHQVVHIYATGKRLRVLMFEGEPHWEAKFLAHALRKDERIELTQVTQISPSKRQTIVTHEQGAQPPRGPADIARFDVVILGRHVERLMDAAMAAALRAFVVEGGGQVIMARGRAYDPATPVGGAIERELAMLEPVIWGGPRIENVTVRPTDDGQTSGWLAFEIADDRAADLLGRLPALSSVQQPTDAKPAARVLATAAVARPGEGRNDRPHGDDNSQGAPLIVAMRPGRGAVVAIMGEGLWRWRLLPPDKGDMSGFYEAFWSSLVRWMVMGESFLPGEQVAMRPWASTIELGQTMAIDVTYRFGATDEVPPQLRVYDPGDEVFSPALQSLGGSVTQYRARFEPKQGGVYRAVLERAVGDDVLRNEAENVQGSPNDQNADPEAMERRFTVIDVNHERLYTSADPTLMRLLAEQTGGMSLQADQWQRFIDQSIASRAATLGPGERRLIWQRAWVMVAVLGWASVEWLIRRKVRLP